MNMVDKKALSNPCDGTDQLQCVTCARALSWKMMNEFCKKCCRFLRNAGLRLCSKNDGNTVHEDLSLRLKRCVDIINSLDASKFPLLLNRITQAMQASPTNEKAFSNEEEEKLQLSLGLEKQDLQLLLESTTFIIEQAAYYMTKPSVLQRHLSETLKLNEDKCEAFINIWMSSAKGIVEHLRQRSLFPTQFEGISWSLNLQTATGAQTKQIIPKAVFQFGLKIEESKEISHENVTVEFTHEELFEFYKQLETIQSQLDGLH